MKNRGNMINVLTYSGLSTKVRGMEKHLLHQEQYSTIKNCSNVTEVVNYLTGLPTYNDIFKDVDISALHRGEFEKYLSLSTYKDFAKLYNFASANQRNFFKIFFMRFETTILKEVIREIYDKKVVYTNLYIYKPYFEKFSDIDLTKLQDVTTVDNYIDVLRNTKYFILLNHVANLENHTLFDFELSLDLLYFKSMWHEKNKYLKGDDLAIMEESYGCMADLLNILWISRCKRSYNVSNEQIRGMMVPVTYKLKKNQLTSMIEADSLDSLWDVFMGTYYGKHSAITEDLKHAYEYIYTYFMDKIHNANFKNHPYSLACVDTYLYKKDEEVKKIIMLTECVRYSLSQSDIDKIVKCN